MKKTIGLLIILVLFTNSAFAIYAPRAMGMGGAFTAIADDAFAAYWNPAGFAINPGIDLAGSYQMTNRNFRSCGGDLNHGRSLYEQIRRIG